MQHAIVFGGFGGQGILFAGHVLAQAAVLEDRMVSWMPSYGPEMRGGTASCTVIVADEEIGSPVVDRYDAAVVMNPPSLTRFGPRVADGGLLIANASLLGDASAERPEIDELRVPCTELAASAGDDKLVSVVALGALVGRLGWVTRDAVIEAIREVVGAKRPEIVEADLQAFEAGIRAATVPVAT
jgi:2-oxoglutarate ferredoxin oxidoreductase subunit gamma